MDIFLIEEPKPVIMNMEEFFKKTKELLNQISQDYSESWASIPLKDEEYPEESICDKCTGCGIFKMQDGEDANCVQDRQDGRCFHRFMDAEYFGSKVESKIEQIHELLIVDILESQPPKPESE